WNVSRVTDMSNMFHSSSFDQNLSNWSVGNTTKMTNMFEGSNISCDNLNALKANLTADQNSSIGSPTVKCSP
ncbi:MAG: BspA family leucine-rich repeat surface protein, partial [Sulfurospirillum sp.]|nr:BspA family leucine-rich repeat surface protein [Sulfurospirillum sp.]